MKRYILIVTADESDMRDPVTIATDDIFATVQSLCDADYDFGIGSINGGFDPEDVVEIASTLEREKGWNGGDHSRLILLVDTQNIDHPDGTVA